MDVLAPAVDLALLGVGGRLDGQRIRANTLSGVVRVLFEGQPIALLTGDLDSLGLEKLFESNDDLRTRVLVFPHHGGHCGGDDREFASAITTAVNPEIVVFSFGRTQHGNPRPEIVAGIRSARPGVHIMCTQLSMRCSTPARFPPYVGRLPAKGKHVGHCCAGSIRFDVEGLDAPSAADHAAFVDDLGPAPLCRLFAAPNLTYRNLLAGKVMSKPVRTQDHPDEALMPRGLGSGRSGAGGRTVGSA